MSRNKNGAVKQAGGEGIPPIAKIRRGMSPSWNELLATPAIALMEERSQSLRKNRRDLTEKIVGLRGEIESCNRQVANVSNDIRFLEGALEEKYREAPAVKGMERRLKKLILEVDRKVAGTLTIPKFSLANSRSAGLPVFVSRAPLSSSMDEELCRMVQLASKYGFSAPEIRGISLFATDTQTALRIIISILRLEGDRPEL
jgi:hypothetical protein